MRSSTVTRGLSALSLVPLAGAAVLVFHTAAFAQQANAPAKQPADAPAKQAADAPAKQAADAPVKEVEKAKAEAKPAAEAAPPTPQELPPEYAPPPGYRRAPPAPPPGYPPYPPPAYGPHYQDQYYPSPPRYYRPRPYGYGPARYNPEGVGYRVFFMGVGLGVGGVGLFPEAGYGSAKSRVGLGYNLHLGFGVSPRWAILLAADGAYSYFTIRGLPQSLGINQSVWSIGPQVFITRQLYARAGIGLASKSITYDSNYDYGDYSDSGMGWTAAIGFEFLQTYHTTVGLEAAATMGHYATIDPITGSKNQGTIAVNFVLKLF